MEFDIRTARPQGPYRELPSAPGIWCPVKCCDSISLQRMTPSPAVRNGWPVKAHSTCRRGLPLGEAIMGTALHPVVSLLLCAVFSVTALPGAAAEAPRAAAILPDSPALHALVSSTLGRDAAAYALRRRGATVTATLGGGASAAIRDGGVVAQAGSRRWGLALVSLGRERGRLRPVRGLRARTAADPAYLTSPH